MSTDTRWAIMPGRNNHLQTIQAIKDLLAQTVPVRVLYIDTGSVREVRDELERWFDSLNDRVLAWWHQPSLPSLSATWNAGLRFVWAQGATEALVVNNDVRLRPDTYSILSRVMARQLVGDSDLPYKDPPLFVSAVGVNEAGWATAQGIELLDSYIGQSYGGPDFSCFLLSREGHDKYPFDENYVPAYCEDCSTHREYMLGGDGSRIFSINLPYLHYASGTINSSTPEERKRLTDAIGRGSRQHYLRKWGGPVNQERFIRPFDETSAADGATNPDLQRMVQAGELFPWEPSPDDLTGVATPELVEDITTRLPSIKALREMSRQDLNRLALDDDAQDRP